MIGIINGDVKKYQMCVLMSNNSVTRHIMQHMQDWKLKKVTWQRFFLKTADLRVQLLTAGNKLNLNGLTNLFF